MLDNRPNAFRINTIDLGCEEGTADSPGIDKKEVDKIFTEDSYDPKCYRCGEIATHRVIAKHPNDNNMYIEKYGYICDNCISCGFLDSSRYGIRRVVTDNSSSILL